MHNIIGLQNLFVQSIGHIMYLKAAPYAATTRPPMMLCYFVSQYISIKKVQTEATKERIMVSIDFFLLIADIILFTCNTTTSKKV